MFMSTRAHFISSLTNEEFDAAHPGVATSHLVHMCVFQVYSEGKFWLICHYTFAIGSSRPVPIKSKLLKNADSAKSLLF